ncbi:serine hydrolase domain-containing protein [Aquimarina sp. LLG6339-5]|uniref:serine hydrolase domain-containing protein n=1 Tax=Aquimarina sp. LLG6339-5 TaxID=3160830 RepID=UPI0038640D7F
MKRNQLTQLIGIVLITIQSTWIQAQPIKNDMLINVTTKQQINRLFEKWDNNQTPGAAVAIIKDGKVIFKNAYGLANLEFGIKNTSSTLFNIASNSKQFTTYGLMNLVETGKIDLEDDIRKYLPELPDFGQTIKVRTLAQHTHGIRGITYLLGMAGWHIEDLISRKEILKLLSQQQELNFQPETDFSYNNTGYMLLAEIIERVSEMPFHQYLDEIVFTPLGMTNTVLFEDYQKVIPNLANPYFFDGLAYKKGIRNSKDIVGNTGIRTNIEDLSKWVINFDKTKIGGKQLLNKLAKVAVLKNGDTLEYALGQRISNYKARKVVSHGGADAGYRSQILRFPDERLSIIVLTNDGSLNADEKAYFIADIFLNNIETIDTKKPIRNTKKSEVIATKQTLKKYEGKFELRPGFVMEFHEEEGQLFITATGQGTLPLETIHEKQFKIRRISALITFIENDYGDFDELVFDHNGQESAGKRIQFHMDSSKLQMYTGIYYSPELKTSYELLIENGILVAKHQRQQSTVLSPLGDHIFSGNTWFFGTFVFEFENNIIKAFRVDSDRVENLVFNKINQKLSF